MALSFSLDSGSGRTGIRGYMLSSSPGQASVQKIGIPSIPTERRGSYDENKLVVTAIGLDCGGYTTTASARFQIYNNSSSHVSSTGTISLPNNGTSTDLPRVRKTYTSSEINGGETVLTGGGTYAFGVWTAGNVGFEKQENSSKDVYRVTSIGSSDNFSTSAWQSSWDSNASLIGKIEYITLTNAPVLVSITPSGSSTTITWNVPTDTGGSGVTGYSIRYAPAGTQTYTYIDTRTTTTPTNTSYVVSGLTGSYDFAVAAYNGASEALGVAHSGVDATSAWSLPLGATVGALGPNIYQDLGDNNYQWSSTEILRWNGSSWVLISGLKVWDGSSWIDTLGA